MLSTKLLATLLLAINLHAQSPQNSGTQSHASEQPSPASVAAKKAAEERIETSTKNGETAVTSLKVISGPKNPIAIGSQVLTGFISYEIKKKVAASEWAMTITQKYAAKAIAGFLTKQEGEPFEVSNSKFEGLIILTFTAKGMNAEKAERLARQEPMEKYQKTGWDRIIFTNGQEAWAWDTSTEIPSKK